MRSAFNTGVRPVKATKLQTWVAAIVAAGSAWGIMSPLPKVPMPSRPPRPVPAQAGTLKTLPIIIDFPVARQLSEKFLKPADALIPSRFPGLFTPYGFAYVASIATTAAGTHAKSRPPSSFAIRLAPLTPQRLSLKSARGRTVATVTWHPAGTGPLSLKLLRATGPWLVYELRNSQGIFLVGAVNLTSHHHLVFSQTEAPEHLQIAIGSHRVVIASLLGARLWTLPAGGGQTLTSSALPRVDFARAKLSLAQGFDASGITLGNLPSGPPTAPGLQAYQVGSLALPFEAPPGWTVIPPSSGPLGMVVRMGDPGHPHRGIWLRISPASPNGLSSSLVAPVSMMAPRISQLRWAWISDVAVGYSMANKSSREIASGIIFLDPQGGVEQLEVKLPASQNALAINILNSVGIPY